MLTGVDATIIARGGLAGAEEAITLFVRGREGRHWKSWIKLKERRHLRSHCMTEQNVNVHYAILLTGNDGINVIERKERSEWKVLLRD